MKQQNKKEVGSQVSQAQLPTVTRYSPTGKTYTLHPSIHVLVDCADKEAVIAFFMNAPQYALMMGARMMYGLTPEGYPKNTPELTTDTIAIVPILESA